MPPPRLADGEVVARAWIAGLVEVTPLEELGLLPVSALAREAPAVCAALVRALGSDDELALLPVLAAGAGSLAGASDPPALAAALARLRDATFAAVLGEAEQPEGAWVARLAARVAYAGDRLLEAALTARPAEPPRPRPAPRREADPRDVPPPRAAGPRGLDLRDLPPREPTPPLPTPEELAAFLGEDDDDEPDDEPPAPPAPSARAASPLPDPLAALDLTRLTVREGAPPWERLIARAVGRHLEDGVPFAVLAVEADGAERLLAAEGGGHALEHADRALGETVRARDRVVSDPPARWWALVPDAGMEEARALARRVAAAVGAIEHGGAPLRVSIGIASCPRDGTEAEVLAATADERLLGARATGRSVTDD